MNGREFLDTNVLIYSHDGTAGDKRKIALELVDRLWSSKAGCVSVQILQEFYVASTGKLTMPRSDAEAQVHRLSKWQVHAPRPDDVLEAIQLQRRHELSFWDAMVVRSAVRLSCEVLWTEDLNPGQVIAGVEVRNPFLAR